jgi:hypothetical protein
MGRCFRRCPRADRDPLNKQKQLEVMAYERIVQQQEAKVNAHAEVKP